MSVILLGLAVVGGWMFELPAIKRVIPGAVEMKANTALGLILAGGALYLHERHRTARRNRWSTILGTLVALLGWLNVYQYLFGQSLGIDELLFKDTAVAYNTLRGRMSPYTAVVFAFLGLGLSTLVIPWLRWFVRGTAGLCLLIGAVSFIGYLWNANELVTDRYAPPVAINTAVAFLILGASTQLATRPSHPDETASLSLIEVRTLIGFAGALLLLILIGGQTYRTALSMDAVAEGDSVIRQSRERLGRLAASMGDAEALGRDYFLTGATADAEACRKLLGEAGEQLREIIPGQASPTDRLRLERIGALVRRRAELLEQALAAFEQGGLAAVQKPAGRSESRDLKLEMRGLIRELDANEAAMVSNRAAALVSSRERTLLSLLVMLVSSLAVYLALFAGIRREMNTRAAAERALRRSENQLSVTIDSIGDALLTTDAGGRVTRLNPIAARLTGWRPEEALGRDRSAVLDLIPDGPASGTAPRPGSEAPTAEGLAEIAPVARLRHRDGTIRLVAQTAAPIRDRDDQVHGMVYVLRDITETRAAERKVQELNEFLRLKTEQLVVANEELESFSYSISHDLRAPLRHVSGYASLLKEELQDGLSESARHYLGAVTQATQHMGQLIEDLLEFSRMSRTQMHEAEVDLPALVAEVVRSFDSVTGSRSVSWRIGELPNVHGDAALLRVVFVNLLGNALKYSAGRDPAVIEVGCTGPAGEREGFFVQDNGAGFNMQFADRLFGVFKRLHRSDEFEGTGIGLAIVHRILSRQGDQIRGEGKVGEGARFSFTLRTIREQKKLPAQTPAPKDQPKGLGPQPGVT